MSDKTFQKVAPTLLCLSNPLREFTNEDFVGINFTVAYKALMAAHLRRLTIQHSAGEQQPEQSVGDDWDQTRRTCNDQEVSKTS